MKPNDTKLVIALGLLLVTGLVFWRCFDSTKDFGLNFFTEILGVALTYFVIDRILNKSREAKELPLEMAIYEDVRLFVSRHISFWTATYRDTVPDEFPERIEDFFSDRGVSKILNFLDLNSSPSVIPKETWWTYYPRVAGEFQTMGSKILDRYSSKLDPKLFRYVHQLTESSFYQTPKYWSSIKRADQQSGFSRGSAFASYSIDFPAEDSEAILQLINWCNERYAYLSHHDQSLKKVSKYSPISDRKLPLKCMIKEKSRN